MWATGVMMYIMLAGQCPFVGKDEKTLFSKITAGRYLVPIGYDGEKVSVECRDLLS
jgi:serine/threonine protein kinase